MGLLEDAQQAGISAIEIQSSNEVYTLSEGIDALEGLVNTFITSPTTDNQVATLNKITTCENQIKEAIRNGLQEHSGIRDILLEKLTRNLALLLEEAQIFLSHEERSSALSLLPIVLGIYLPAQTLNGYWGNCYLEVYEANEERFPRKLKGHLKTLCSIADSVEA